MAKTQLNIRIPETLIEALDKQALATGKTKTDIVSMALTSYLNVDTGTPDLSDILRRLELLESKIEASDKKLPKAKKETPTINPDELGDLITKAEASQITGYSIATFHREFSQKGIMQKGQRGKAGLYSKEEILTKIGIK